MTQIIILLLFASVLVFSSVASEPLSDFQLVSSGKDLISFKLYLSEPDKYLLFAPEVAGATMLRSVVIAVPAGKQPILLSASGSDPIQPSPSAPALYDAGKGIVEILPPIRSRGFNLATVNIYPFQQGQIYRSIDVAISFHPDNKVAVDDEWTRMSPTFEKIWAQTVLNYEQMVTWSNEMPQTAAKIAQNPFEPSDAWYRIDVNREGIVRVTGQNLQAAGLSLANLRSDNLRLFNGGGEPLPVLNNRPRPTFSEISLLIFDGGDGLFNAADYFLFFAEGADRWRYPSDSAPVFLANPYTVENCYWLTTAGTFSQPAARIDSINGNPDATPDTVVTEGKFFLRFEQNKMLMYQNDTRIADYYTWYWSDQGAFTFFASVPNAILNRSAKVRIAARTAGTTLMVNNILAQQTYASPTEYTFNTDRLFPGFNRLTLGMTPNFDAPPFFDFCEISYDGNLAPSGDLLDFAFGDSLRLAEFHIADNFNSPPLIFDLNNPQAPRLIFGAPSAADTLRFQYAVGENFLSRFYLCPPGKAIQPLRITKYNRPDLMNTGSQADLLLIAPSAFLPALQEYRQYREQNSGITIKMVALQEILNQFSYGLNDPTAIRDFLKFAYENYPSPAPSAVLLVGDGNYDFENNLSTATVDLLPPYIHPYDSTASDDNYVYFGLYGLLDSDTSYYQPDRGYDMMIARWPVKSVSELNIIMNKIRHYESSSNFGPWRATVTLVADDEIGTYDTESFHTRQTEELQRYHLPPAFYRNKIYLWDYPFDSNRQKPLVNDAIVRSINNGTLAINYAGHGNPDTWAHERVFNRNTDLPRLQNADRLTLVFTASCSIGFFDDPTREGMAEDLLRYPGGGAIATVAATRLVYAGENSDFNQQIFDVLFGGGNLSICEAFFAGKLVRQYSSGYPRPIRNDRTYAFFGDPYLKLGVPKYQINFSSLPDTLMALRRHDISGEIIDSLTGNRVAVDGTIDIFVYDSEIEKSYKVVNSSGQITDIVNYALAGSMIYRGTAEVTDGRFRFSFIAPLDIGYGGRGAKISVYGAFPTSDAFTLADSLPVSPHINPVTDSVGPSIAVRFGDRTNFVSGDKIRSGEPLEIEIEDQSGINLIGGSGHGLILTVDNQIENMRDLTELFRYNPGSYTEGTIVADIGALAAGRHAFSIKVWDNANNSRVEEFEAEVVAADKMMISELLNHPNPMSDETLFSFSLTGPARQVSLKIFTLSGRKIKEISRDYLRADYHEFYRWNGTDNLGDRVANGVYLYKVTAASEATGEVVEAVGKVVVN
jgi:hypothetical protein